MKNIYHLNITYYHSNGSKEHVSDSFEHLECAIGYLFYITREIREKQQFINNPLLAMTAIILDKNQSLKLSATLEDIT